MSKTLGKLKGRLLTFEIVTPLIRSYLQLTVAIELTKKQI